MQMRTENGVIREQLNRLEEQQKTLLRLIDQLQHRLDGTPAPIAHTPPRPPPPSPEAEPPAQTAEPAKLAPAQTARDRNIAAEDPYDDSIVMVKTREDARNSDPAPALGHHPTSIHQHGVRKRQLCRSLGGCPPGHTAQ
jgi:hypothetical protein